MFPRYMRLPRPPVFADDLEKTGAAEMLFYALWSGVVMSLVFAGVSLFFAGQYPSVLLSASTALVCGLGIWQVRRGQVRRAALLLGSMIWLVLICAGISYGELQTPLLPGYLLVILFSGLMLGRRIMVIFAAACGLGWLMTAVVNASPYLDAPLTTPDPRLARIIGILMAGYIVIFLYLVIRQRENVQAQLQLNAYKQQQLVAQLQSTTISRAYLDNIIHSMAEMLIVVDPDAYITMVNHAAIERLGYTEDELVGQPVEKLFADLAMGKTGVDTLRQQGYAQSMDKALVTKSGHRIPVLMSGKVMYNANRRMEGIVCVLQDVTEIRDIQHALHLSNERYQLAILGSQVIIFDWDLSTNRVTTDGDPTALLGYPADELPDTFAGWTQYILAEDVPMLVEALQAHFAGGPALFEKEVRMVHKTGQLIWMLLRGSVIRDRQGQPVRMLTTAIDITERKRIEEALRLSEARFHVALRNAPVLVFNQDRQLRYTWVNDGWSNFSPHQVTGKTDRELMERPEEAAAMIRIKQAVLDSGQSARHEVTVHINGIPHYYDLTVDPLFDEAEQVTGITCAVVDITGRKEMEEALRRTITRNAALLAAIPDMLIRTRSDGTHIEVLPGAELKPAQPLEQYPGKHLQDVMPAVTAEGLMQAIAETLRTGQTQVFEYQYQQGEEVRDLEARTVLAGDDEVLHIIRDITARKRAEKQALELAIQREQTRVLTQFIRDASHEFRTPLTVVRTNLYLLEHSADPDQRQRMIRRIDQQVDTLEALVQALLLMSQLDSGAVVDMRRLDLNHVVAQVQDTLQTAIAGKRIEVKVQLATDLVPVQGDLEYFCRAVSEILDNAIRYTPEQGVIVIRTFNNAGDAVIEIRDSGPGIPPAVLPHIFKRFYREDKSHSTRGFGLGLSIAQSIIKRHQGTIEVESTPGNGSLFRVAVPRQEANQSN